MEHLQHAPDGASTPIYSRRIVQFFYLRKTTEVSRIVEVPTISVCEQSEQPYRQYAGRLSATPALGVLKYRLCDGRKLF
jgi:hypothetical protein